MAWVRAVGGHTAVRALGLRVHSAALVDFHGVNPPLHAHQLIPSYECDVTERGVGKMCALAQHLQHLYHPETTRVHHPKGMDDANVR